MRQILIAISVLALAGCETMPEWTERFRTTPASASTPAPTPAPVALTPAPAPVAAPAAYAPPADQQLLELERRLAAAAQQAGLGGAYGPQMDSTDGFIVRPGVIHQGAEAVTTGLGGPTGSPIFWQPDKVFVSRAGDMGMTSGRYVQVVRGAEAAQGRYVVVWRRDSGGEWRILTETRTPDPPRARRR